ISVCTEKADDMQDRTRDASSVGDLVELRLDCLDNLSTFNLSPKPNFILTFRPGEQGGTRSLTFKERAKFWQAVNDSCGADLEEDIIQLAASRGFKPKICSFHDFSGRQSDLSDVYQRLSATPADVVKIAIRADDVCNAIDVWKLINRAKAEN